MFRFFPLFPGVMREREKHRRRDLVISCEMLRVGSISFDICKLETSEMIKNVLGGAHFGCHVGVFFR